MTTIYLDTSVAMNESFLRSPYSEAFLKACSILQYTVVIPEIVIDELKGNFPKKYKDKSAAFQKAKKDLGKLIDLDVPIVPLKDAVNSYEDWLEEMIDQHAVVIAPYPNVSAKEIVEQSYEVKKPFKESGEGHKDYVIWKTILAHIASQKTTSPNIFLTNNTKDFCDIKDNGIAALHSDLAAQIESPAHRPRVYTSIKGAFDAELSPNLEGITLDDFPDLGTHDVDTMVGEFLLEDLPSRSLYGLEGVPFGNEITISLIGPHSIESVALKRFDNEIVMKVMGTIELEVYGFMDKFGYYSIESEKPNIDVLDGNWNDHMMMVSSTIETNFDLTIFYSTQNSVFTGFEVSLPQEIEDDWPYK